MSHKPPGHTAVTPYLSVDDPERLIAFVTTVFNGELLEKYEDESGVIRHGKVRIDDACIELSATNPAWPATPAALHVYVTDVDSAHARALAAGAKELHPPMDQPYGERSSAVRDTNGNNWYIARHTGNAKQGG